MNPGEEKRGEREADPMNFELEPLAPLPETAPNSPSSPRSPKVPLNDLPGIEKLASYEVPALVASALQELGNISRELAAIARELESIVATLE